MGVRQREREKRHYNPTVLYPMIQVVNKGFGMQKLTSRSNEFFLFLGRVLYGIVLVSEEMGDRFSVNTLAFLEVAVNHCWGPCDGEL